MNWTWQLDDGSGAPAQGAIAGAAPAHPTQSDAETWLGETWRALSDEGVTQASLLHDGARVYGPMQLRE